MVKTRPGLGPAKVFEGVNMMRLIRYIYSSIRLGWLGCREGKEGGLASFVFNDDYL